MTNHLEIVEFVSPEAIVAVACRPELAASSEDMQLREAVNSAPNDVIVAIATAEIFGGDAFVGTVDALDGFNDAKQRSIAALTGRAKSMGLTARDPGGDVFEQSPASITERGGTVRGTACMLVAVVLVPFAVASFLSMFL